MTKITLEVEGMTCSACSNGLEKYLNKQTGIIKAAVNLVMANTTIEYDEKLLSLKQIEKFIEEAGFKSLGEFKTIKVERQNKKEKIKFIIFTILAILLIYISMGHMLNLPTINLLNPHDNPLWYSSCLLIFTIAFIVYGYDILKNGYKNLIHKTPNMDTLVSIGVVSSLLYSLYSMLMIIRGNYTYINNIYFESCSIVIYFIKLGRYIDKVSKDKTKEAVQKLTEITPNLAVIRVGDKEKTVTIDEIKKGDIVIARAGDKIAVDGEIILGTTHLDETFITGESRPVEKTVKSKVMAGSMNYDGYIEYKAERIGKESTISEIVKLVVEATNTKTRSQQIADTVSSYFVPVIIIVAVLTFIVYLLSGQTLQLSLITFVTILVVACPCSLGLATPLAIVISEGRCASNGILIKESAVLEKAEKVNTVVFDKTGTLTYGKLKISEIKNYSDMTVNELLELVCSIEKKSSHPISQAFIEYLTENNLNTLETQKVKELAGLGIKGMVNQQEYIIGNDKILKKYKITNNYLEDAKKITQKGNSLVYIATKSKVIAIIGVNDIIRDNAKTLIKQLKSRNIKTIMLTGDNQETANAIAKSLKIDQVIANVLPQEKAKIIKQLKQDNNYVMMCGDGINDSLAIINADIGVGISSGSDIAINSADVILTSNNLLSIINLITISKQTLKNIKQNLFWAFFYNLLMIPIAMGLLKPLGITINPMIASLAMVCSSLTVILNALRLRKIKFI